MHENLCDYIYDELDELDRKVKDGGKLSVSEVEYADMLAHLEKSLVTIDAMKDHGGYSERGRDWRDGDTRGNSYARDRESRRDARGRYSRDGGYSYADGYHAMLEEAMRAAPDEQARENLRRMMSET